MEVDFLLRYADWVVFRVGMLMNKCLFFTIQCLLGGTCWKDNHTDLEEKNA